MLSVTYKPYMLSVVMLNVVMLSVVAPKNVDAILTFFGGKRENRKEPEGWLRAKLKM